MGVWLGKFSTKEGKAKKSEMNHTLRSSIVECNNIKEVRDSGKTVRFLTNANDEIVATPLSKETSARPKSKLHLKRILKLSPSGRSNDFSKQCPFKWNFEDEFKSYLQESTKRKLRNSDISQPPKKPKLDKVRSTFLYHSSDQDCRMTSKLKSISINLLGCFSDDSNGGMMDGKVVLEKLPKSVISYCIPKKADECLKIGNKSRSLRNRVFSSCNEKYTKVQNLKLIERQLGMEPRVVLDSSIVTKYLQANRIINEILKAS